MLFVFSAAFLLSLCMSAEIESERGLRVDTNQQNQEERLKDGQLPTSLAYGFNANGTIVLYLPALLYGFVTQLIKVDLSQKQVQGKFSIFVTIKVNLDEEIMANLRRQQLKAKREDQKQFYIKDQLTKLTHFIKNNLIVECGEKVIDIINAQGENSLIQNNSQERQIETDQQEEQSQDQQNYYYWIKMPSLNKEKSVTYQIIGTFKCSFELYNLFFPYHHVNSSLCVKVRQQYFNRMVLRYDLYKFNEHPNQYEIRQFSLKFTEENDRRFGNYRINCCPSTYGAKVVTENLQQIFDTYHHHKQVQISSIDANSYQITNKTLFKFQIYSYNVPFMLRYMIPLLVLCFASLMVFFADSTQVSSTFGNVILIGITLIQQLSNFRTSKYDTASLNFYQATILGIIFINFLLVIITTQNFYTLTDVSQIQKKQANANSVVFWIAVGIACLCLLVNVAIIIYFKYKVANAYSWEAQKEDEKKQWNHLWIWNQQLFGNLENQISFGDGPHIIGIRRTVSPLM